MVYTEVLDSYKKFDLNDLSQIDSLLKPNANPVFPLTLFLYEFLEYFTQLHSFALHIKDESFFLPIKVFI